MRDPEVLSLFVKKNLAIMNDKLIIVSSCRLCYDNLDHRYHKSNK